MSEKSLILRDPSTALEGARQWKQMVKDGSAKKRAGDAVQANDWDELESLLYAHVKLKSRSRGNTSPRTLQTYWRGSKRLLQWCIDEGLKPYKLVWGDIELWIVSMAEKLSPSSQQTYLKGAKALVAALAWTGWNTDLDPFLDEHGRVFQIRDINAKTIKADPYSNDELNAMLSAANGRGRAIVLLGCDAGLRVAEMVDLTWSGIDFERSTLKFKGKGNKQAKVQATSRLMTALGELRRYDNDHVLQPRRRRLQQILTEICKRAGVKARGIHQLRHSCGTRLMELQPRLEIAQRHLRHEDISSTLIYITLADSDYLAAIDLLGENGIE